MRIVLNTFGSFGDVHPYMAIAMELQRRGHAPLIAAMEGYREKILGAGLEFAPVRPDVPPPKEQGTELVEKIMEPKTGPRFLMDGLVFPAVRERAVVGAAITFAGCAEAPESLPSGPLLEIVPLAIGGIK